MMKPIWMAACVALLALPAAWAAGEPEGDDAQADEKRIVIRVDDAESSTVVQLNVEDLEEILEGALEGLGEALEGDENRAASVIRSLGGGQQVVIVRSKKRGDDREQEMDVDRRIVIEVDDGGAGDGIRIDLGSFGDVLGDIMDGIGDALDAAGESLGSALGSVRFGDRYYVARAEAGNTRPVDISKKAPGNADVEIYNVAGSVTVVGWKKDEIHVEGTLGEDVEELEFDVSGRRAKVRVRVPRRGRKKIKSDLTIHVPSGSSIAIETVSASIGVSDVVGEELDLESVSGSIDVRGCAGDAELQSVSGSVEMQDAQGDVEAESVSGMVRIGGRPLSVHAETVSGSVRISGARESVEAESVSGSIAVEAAALEELDVETVSGSVRYEGALDPDGEVDINSLSGSVRLEFDRPVSGEYELTSFSGSINVQFGPSDGTSGRRTSGKKELHFTHGDGDADISVETFSGSITIRGR